MGQELPKTNTLPSVLIVTCPAPIPIWLSKNIHGSALYFDTIWYIWYIFVHMVKYNREGGGDEFGWKDASQHLTPDPTPLHVDWFSFFLRN